MTASNTWEEKEDRYWHLGGIWISDLQIAMSIFSLPTSRGLLITILVRVSRQRPPTPPHPPNHAQQTNKRTVDRPSGPLTPPCGVSAGLLHPLAHKHRNPQSADCIQIALSAGCKLSFGDDEFQCSDICRGLLMQATKEWLSSNPTQPTASHARRDAKSVGLLLLFNYQVWIFASVLCGRVLSSLMLFSFSSYGTSNTWFRSGIPNRGRPIWQEEGDRKTHLPCMLMSSYQNTFLSVKHRTEILVLLF